MSTDVSVTLPAAPEVPSHLQAATIGGIPVRNIWLLMLYASALFREIPAAKRLAVEDNPDDIPDLVAEILVHAVQRRLRRNLSLAFQTRHADLNRVRGHIDMLRTERRQLLQRGKVACRFEELTVDTPKNRFVREALTQIARVVDRPDLASRCRAASASLERAGVNADPLPANPRGRSVVATSLRGRMDAEDRRMLAAARLAFDLALPTEDPGLQHLTSPDRNLVLLWKLFEKAVGGFYAVVLTPGGWRVDAGKHLHWPVEHATAGLTKMLPSMITDIVLEYRGLGEETGGRRIVIDTKLTSILTSGQYRTEMLRSGYIYQIYAYLRSQERDDDPMSAHAAGVLLHPSVGREVDEGAVIQGHEVRFVTVDLAADSRAIRERLLHIVADRTPA